MPARKKSATAGAVPSPQPLHLLYSYPTHLARAVENPGGKRKGERTRDRILAETARILNDRGFGALRQPDICEAAGIGVATFYLYFQDKLDACLHVLRGFTAFMQQVEDARLVPLQTAARLETDPYASFLHANLTTLWLARANTGLFRCFLDTAAETDAPMRLWREISAGWYRRVARNLVRRGIAEPSDRLLLRAALAGGMVDEFLRALLIGQTPDLVALSERECPTDAALAALLSDAWYRLVFGRDPPADRVAAALALLEASGAAR